MGDCDHLQNVVVVVSPCIIIPTQPSQLYPRLQGRDVRHIIQAHTREGGPPEPLAILLGVDCMAQLHLDVLVACSANLCMGRTGGVLLQIQLYCTWIPM